MEDGQRRDSSAPKNRVKHLSFAICTENDMIDKDIKFFSEVLSKDYELISDTCL
jgi:hypothetical protein